MFKQSNCETKDFVKMDKVEFPVILEETNEIVTLLLDEQSAARATQDQKFLRNLVAEHKKNVAGQDNIPDFTAVSEKSNSKGFTWPDVAVLLLIDIYREKENEFKNGIQRHNQIWKQIATELQEANYPVSGLQCSTKLAGLRRTYKNIYNQNKKSGNTHSSWAFYSAMDSLMGEKLYMEPPAEASSEGPAPSVASTSSSSSPMVGSEDLQNAPKKRRFEEILEKHIADIKQEWEIRKQQRDEERRITEEKREARYNERKILREKMHKENMEIQRSLVSVLQTIANKK
ncbi:uncharacterized protein LOC143208084 [Lasioglossum baleicum]|uniref:uncharacterized protein LOC143208084 n=1 Tax=Lasioglossum baleicum TaxID=434251 RepID=UPI003FCCA826